MAPADGNSKPHMVKSRRVMGWRGVTCIQQLANLRGWALCMARVGTRLD